jgi:nucleotide-binding universal stress UspA family protein
MSRTVGYRSILVPVAGNAETDQALDVACRLAADHGSTIMAVAAIEVPPVLPLGAHMLEEEAAAKLLLRRADAVAESYGVRMRGCIVRGREAGPAIVEEAKARRIELIVVGAPRARRRPFGRCVESVLKHAACRVLVIAQPGSRPVRTAA